MQFHIFIIELQYQYLNYITEVVYQYCTVLRSPSTGDPRFIMWGCTVWKKSMRVPESVCLESKSKTNPSCVETEIKTYDRIDNRWTIGFIQNFMIQFDFFFINPTVSEANMVDTCKHFEIRSGSVRSLSHLPVFVIEHLCRNTKQIK